MRDAEPLVRFPCRFPIKVLGNRTDDFPDLVIEIVSRHVGDLSPESVTHRASRTGKYLAVTVTIEALSQEQLDGVYRDLSSHQRIIMAL
jgi:putative lipoic acid-binding regulatory protein